MSDLYVCALASLLRYLPPDSFHPLRDRLSAGASLEAAVQDLPDGPLQAAIADACESSCALDGAKKILDWADSSGAVLLHPWHESYPRNFLGLDRPPVFLSMMGTPVWRERVGLGVVGSREPSQDVLQWLDSELGRSLCSSGAFTVSGGARGVDQKAHAVSIRSGAPTVAFLPSGLKHPYPNSFASWIDAIREGGGAVVSEFEPDEEMERGHFERRNRMIAVLGCGLFVAEAARKSGSMMTARLALNAGCQVAALPSSPLQHRGAGTLDLICDGATVIRDARDLALFIAFNSMRGGG